MEIPIINKKIENEVGKEVEKGIEKGVQKQAEEEVFANMSENNDHETDPSFLPIPTLPLSLPLSADKKGNGRMDMFCLKVRKCIAKFVLKGLIAFIFQCLSLLPYFVLLSSYFFFFYYFLTFSVLIIFPSSLLFSFLLF